MSNANAMIDAAVKCLKCGTQGYMRCSCWQKCKHGVRHESKCTVCTVKCSCGWYTETNQVCENPETRACMSRVHFGKYNRKTKKYEPKTATDYYNEYIKVGKAIIKSVESGEKPAVLKRMRQREEFCRLEWQRMQEKPVSTSAYGTCPLCGAACKFRSRCVDGEEDECENGHKYRVGEAVEKEKGVKTECKAAVTE